MSSNRTSGPSRRDGLSLGHNFYLPTELWAVAHDGHFTR